MSLVNHLYSFPKKIDWTVLENHSSPVPFKGPNLVAVEASEQLFIDTSYLWT